MGEFTKTVIVDSEPGSSTPYHSIQDGIDALGGSGGTVIVEKGIYSIGQNQDIYIPSNVTLIGRGDVVLEITHKDTSAFRAENHATPNGSNSRIVISGFKIVVKVDDFENHPIFLRNVSNCIIEKVYVTSRYDANTVYKINAVSSGTTAILLITYGANGVCEDNIIRHCAVVDFGKTVPGHPGVHIEDEHYYGYGIGITSVTDSAMKCKRNRVINNYLRNTLGYSLVGAEDSIVSGNIAAYTQWLWNNGTQVYDPWSGFSLRYCDNSSVVGNQAHLNTGHGIYLSESSRCSLCGNICANNMSDGMKLNTEDVESQYNTYSGNVCFDNGEEGGRGGNGILIVSQGELTSYNTVYGNVCRDNLAEGILESPVNLSDYNNVAGNMCESNGGEYDIYLYGVHSQNSFGNLGSLYPEP